MTNDFFPHGPFSMRELPTGGAEGAGNGTDRVLTRSATGFTLVHATREEGFHVDGFGEDGRRETWVVLSGRLRVEHPRATDVCRGDLEAGEGAFFAANAPRRLTALTRVEVLVASSKIITPSADYLANPKHQHPHEEYIPESIFSVAAGGRFPSVHHVSKPWGGEDWITVLPNGYVLKRIRMLAGHRCSLQKHDFKVETNLLVEGAAALLLEDEAGEMVRTELGAGDGWYVPRGRVHRVFALQTYVAYEISTPEVHDVIRLADDAGRGHGFLAGEHGGQVKQIEKGV